MEKPLFSNNHYNLPGHAHELTFSVYRGLNAFQDTCSFEMMLNELKTAWEEFAFRLWVYVIMPKHVHPLLWPLEAIYKIESINKAIKGRMAKRYFKLYKEKVSNSCSGLPCLRKHSLTPSPVEG